MTINNSPIDQRIKKSNHIGFNAQIQNHGRTKSVGIESDPKILSKDIFFRPRVSPFESIKDNVTNSGIGLRGKSQLSSSAVKDKRMLLARTCNDGFKQPKAPMGEAKNLAGTLTILEKIGDGRKNDKGKKKGQDVPDGKFRIEKESPMKKRKAFEIELHKMYGI